MTVWGEARGCTRASFDPPLKVDDETRPLAASEGRHPAGRWGSVLSPCSGEAIINTDLVSGPPGARVALRHSRARDSGVRLISIL